MAPTRRTPVRQLGGGRNDSVAMPAPSQARQSAERRAASAARRAALTERRSSSAVGPSTLLRPSPPIVHVRSTASPRTDGTIPPPSSDVVSVLPSGPGTPPPQFVVPSSTSPSSGGLGLPNVALQTSPDATFGRGNRAALNERSMRSAFDYVSYPVPETRRNEVAQGRQITRELSEPGVASEGPRVNDLQNLPPRHLRVGSSVMRTALDPQQASSSFSRSIRRLASPVAGLIQRSGISTARGYRSSPGPRPRPRFAFTRDVSPSSVQLTRPRRNLTTPTRRQGLIEAAQALEAFRAAPIVTQTQPQSLPWNSNPAMDHHNATNAGHPGNGSDSNQPNQQRPQGEDSNRAPNMQEGGEIVIWTSPNATGGQGSGNAPASVGQENEEHGNDGTNQSRVPLGELPLDLDPDHPFRSIEDQHPSISPSNHGSLPNWGHCHPCPDFPDQVHHVCGRGCPGLYIGNPGSPPMIISSRSSASLSPRSAPRTQLQSIYGTPLGNQEAEAVRIRDIEAERLTTRDREAADNPVANSPPAAGQSAASNREAGELQASPADVVHRSMSDPFSGDVRSQANSVIPPMLEISNAAPVPTPGTTESVFGAPPAITPTPNPSLPVPTLTDYDMMNVAELRAEAIRRGFDRASLNRRKAELIAILQSADANNNRGNGAYGYRAFEINQGRPDPGPRVRRPAAIDDPMLPTEGGPARRTRSHAK